MPWMLLLFSTKLCNDVGMHFRLCSFFTASCLDPSSRTVHTAKLSVLVKRTLHTLVPSCIRSFAVRASEFSCLTGTWNMSHFSSWTSVGDRIAASIGKGRPVSPQGTQIHFFPFQSFSTTEVSVRSLYIPLKKVMLASIFSGTFLRLLRSLLPLQLCSWQISENKRGAFRLAGCTLVLFRLFRER